MKRVLDPADIDVITSILDETKSKSFAENHVADLTGEAISALESTGFTTVHEDFLAESARQIVGSV
jgi:hypothetical protein